MIQLMQAERERVEVARRISTPDEGKVKLSAEQLDELRKLGYVAD